MARATDSMFIQTSVLALLLFPVAVAVVGCTATRPEENEKHLAIVGGIPPSEQLAKDRVGVLVRNINQQDPVLTPAVVELSSIGLPALRLGLLELLLDNDPMTRQRAQRALELIVDRHCGWKPGRGWTQLQAEAAGFLIRGMDYRWDASLRERDGAYRRWKEWVDEEFTSTKKQWAYGSR